MSRAINPDIWPLVTITQVAFDFAVARDAWSRYLLGVPALSPVPLICHQHCGDQNVCATLSMGPADGERSVQLSTNACLPHRVLETVPNLCYKGALCALAAGYTPRGMLLVESELWHAGQRLLSHLEAHLDRPFSSEKPTHGSPQPRCSMSP